jgi:tetratricopeptide (TPR) repeat protein
MRKEAIGLLVLLVGVAPAVAAEQTTSGWCSPAQSGNDNVVICNGVDPRAMKRLNDDLDRMDLTLKQKTDEADEWVRKYNVLNEQFEATKKQLAARGEDPTLVETAQDLLHEGRLEEARKIYDRLIASDEGNVDRAVQDYFDRATIFALQFRTAEALSDYAKTYQYRPTNPLYASNYASAAYRERHYAEAERGWMTCLQLYSELALRDPGAYRPDVAKTLHNFGNLYRDTGRFADAEKAYTEAIAIRRELAVRDPGAYRPDVAGTLNNLGNLYADTGRLADAEKAYTEAIAIFRELALSNPNLYEIMVTITNENLSDIHAQMALHHIKSPAAMP